MENVIIWGAGAKGRAAFTLLDESHGGDFRVLFFVDSNPHLVGKSWCGRLVYPPQQLEMVDSDIRILIASSEFSSIWNQLYRFYRNQNFCDAGKFVMFQKFARQFPLCMKQIWGSERSNTDHEDGREDLIVEAIFNAVGIREPKYCDIGARNAVGASNTYLFYEKGVRGMAIDPLPDYVSEWATVRPEDEFLNIALSDVAMEQVPFYAVAGTGSSDIEDAKFQAGLRRTRFKTILVKQETFNHVVEKDIDWVDIDTDGVDMKILQSIDFDQYPKLSVVLIEQTSSECVDYMASQGYVHFISNFVNSIFIRESIADTVFNDKLCSEIWAWHKMWLLLQDKQTDQLVV